ncbi:MAG: NAD-dependent epimerase/dehydratase family protein, partial [Clostridia bacterium]|nr:NAD-dependent epimerase/dehydratase family protein [Clostridia bacterium]
ALNNQPEVADKIKLLVRSKKRANKVVKKFPKIKKKIEYVFGGLENADACKKLVEDVDIVFNLCAVIPPKADNDPQATIACNVTGVKTLITAIEALGDNQPSLVHMSSVAVYGNRCGEHMYGRVGEPLVSGPFELYSATKIAGEYAVLQSEIKKWAVVRQTAVLHYNLFNDNIKDGLMFHTPFNAPFEWATVKDSGTLLLNILKREKGGDMPENFWKRVYNIGGGKGTRCYGYMTYDAGFSIIGGGFKSFFKPWYNATRNFHGMFYSDSDELENFFHYRSQSCDDFWAEMAKKHKIYKAGKIVPKGLINSIIIKPLLKDRNAPSKWLADGDEAKAVAYFGGMDKYEELKKKDWKDIELLTEIPEFKKPTAQENIEAYGYDIDKEDKDITADDLEAVAKAHGGKILNADDFDGDMYKKLDWETQDGEKFTASAYTVLRAGHWENSLYHSFVWDFDRLSKKDKIFARIWYDSHEKDEDNVYSFDENFKAHVDKLKTDGATK